MKLLSILPVILFFSALANAQLESAKWNLKADLQLIDRCSQATRFVIKSVELFPRNVANRDAFIESVMTDLRQTNKWGDKTPSDIDIFFAKIPVETMLLSGKELDMASRDLFITRSAAACALHSSRVNQSAP